MSEVLYTLRWIIYLEVFQVIFLPMTIRWGKHLFGQGILLSRLIGILTVSFCVWILASLHIVPFSLISIIFTLTIFCGINFFFFKKEMKLIIQRKFLQKFFIAELLFLIPFICWTMLRGFNPNIENFEKFMDFSFVNSILRSNYFPPQDAWFAGQPINYYYFGHLFSAVLIKLTNIPSTIGYNLMIATVVALSSVTAFTIGTSLTQQFSKVRRIQIIGGVLSTLFVNFAGTLYTFSFLFEKQLESFWFWKSIRLIPGAIHEFPQYSFGVADLHAHVLNIPVVLLILCSTFVLWKKDSSIRAVQMSSYVPHAVHGMLLGISFMVSAWDLPMYLGLTGLTLFIRQFQKTTNIFHVVISSVQNGLAILVGVILSVILFWIKFDFSISEGFDVVHSHTEVKDYLTLWIPALSTLGFALIFWFFKWRKEKNNRNIILLAIWSAWAIFLTFIPEIIYIKDIYGGEFYRGNTIFKFYYQAFIILGITCGVLLTKLLHTKLVLSKRLLLVIPITLWMASLAYPFQILPSYYNDFQQWYGLDGSHFMQIYHPDDHQAIQWLSENVSGQPVVLEASGDSYSYDNRVSTFTGLPTVQGWFVHEWLWRGGADKPGQRANDVREFYEGTDLNVKREFIKKYAVRFIYIGEVERRKYPQLQIDTLKQLGPTVFENQHVWVIQITEL